LVIGPLPNPPIPNPQKILNFIISLKNFIERKFLIKLIYIFI